MLLLFSDLKHGGKRANAKPDKRKDTGRKGRGNWKIKWKGKRANQFGLGKRTTLGDASEPIPVPGEGKRGICFPFPLRGETSRNDAQTRKHRKKEGCRKERKGKLEGKLEGQLKQQGDAIINLQPHIYIYRCTY